METLLEKNGSTLFLIDFEEGDYEYSVTFNLYEVTHWNIDTKEVEDSEQILKGKIKWDGDCHFWFEDGYLYLCGKEDLDNHKLVMDAIWNICSKKIKYFDSFLSK
jgi:hypothetical protein